MFDTIRAFGDYVAGTGGEVGEGDFGADRVVSAVGEGSGIPGAGGNEEVFGAYSPGEVPVTPREEAASEELVLLWILLS